MSQNKTSKTVIPDFEYRNLLFKFKKLKFDILANYCP